MMDCPNLTKMQKLFERKKCIKLRRKMVVEVKTIIVDVNVVDINVATRSIIKKIPSVLGKRTMEEQK